MRGRRYPFDNVDRLFDQMRSDMFGSWNTPAFGNETGFEDEGGWDAGVSIEETDDGFVVLADLPGFERDELSLRLHDDELHLSGEHEVGDGMGYRSRTVTESITLPAHVDPEDASATYRNGVLEVRFTVDEDEAISGSNIDIE
ncbi:Hsp20/alpha crystallin family protein [Haloarcula pellucida]|uniref:Type III effector protein n=1 Tax=Haloarcula pellucida TaxID=1427151 RepID=A0A830GHQ5_9EURY|nr:Hsp20/alpha crystallin family protein [Halomicroarcula pellucida]MBX0347208.1 Hsp20/alpha crystallin family protein [Halomicroarcula pellucida]GGN87516.1 type III effector protein [Halomicroarcula pellucida]